MTFHEDRADMNARFDASCLAGAKRIMEPIGELERLKRGPYAPDWLATHDLHTLTDPPIFPYLTLWDVEAWLRERRWSVWNLMVATYVVVVAISIVILALDGA